MTERGHTSSMTSVTEEDSSLDSESDTTESSYSNVTSSVLSSTDTDDKLTPSLVVISISPEAKSKHQKQSFIVKDTSCDDKVKMERNMKDPLSKNVDAKTLQHDNIGVEDAENKLSTDFSDTSSRAFAQPDATSQLGVREGGEESNDADSILMQEGAGTATSDEPTDHVPWEPDMSSSNWYQAGCFDRYWRHYSFVMSWYRTHMDAVHKLHKDMSTPMLRKQRCRTISDTGGLKQETASHGHDLGGRSTSRQRRRARRARNRRIAKAKFRAAKNFSASQGVGSTHGASSSKTEDLEDNVSMEMEITEDMLDFLKTSLKHKMERETAKTDATQEKLATETRVNIENATAFKTAPSTAPPQERPGARRALEMKQLYGAGAPMIHGMETALQMTFDRMQDKFQPKLWPNMPLKIIFG